VSAEITIYQYPNCSTCRKALKWLDARGLAYVAIDLVERPPSVEVLRTIRARAGVELRKLFNVSGQSYRQGGWKDKLARIDDAEALAALAADGKLIKRPLLLMQDRALVGFDASAWADALE
jgi:arsenate reductase